MSIGIDIGSKTIKIIELEGSDKSFKLKSSGVIGYAGNPVEQLKSEKEYAIVAEIIMKLVKESGVSSKDVAIALPESSVFTRVVKFPALTDQEISSAIKWEAEQYIPIPLKDAIVQHQILERQEKVTPPSVSVLLVAAPRNLVQAYVKVVQMAELNPIAVETELVSLVRAVSYPNQVNLVLDFGARSTDIAISRNGNLVFSRSIPTAGDAFTRAIAQNLGISPQQAEQYKRTYGLAGDQLEGKIKDALDPIFRSVVDEIKKAVQYYKSEERGESPQAVIISGGSAGIPQIIPLLSNLLGLEVVIANPFTKIQVGEDIRELVFPYAPLYAVAAGLALRE